MRSLGVTEFPTHLSVDEARLRVLELGCERRLASETIDLHRAFGRVLAVDVVAGHDLPPFPNSAMDGFALQAADLPASGERQLRIVGTRLAGDPHAAIVGAGEAVRITTGAHLPRGADSVVIKERVRVVGDALIVCSGEIAGANVRSAGEDYRAGEVALPAGVLINAGRLGVLASIGRMQVDVACRPRVAVVTTGDELVMPGQALGFAQIHNSNGYSIAALVEQAGAICIDHAPPFRHVRDDRSVLSETLIACAARVDIVITTGGVSAGEADFLPGLLAEIGKVHFWKVRMRPGMPVLCGEIGTTLVFGLPGNPVSSIATFLTLVKPVIAALQGASDAQPARLFARLAAPVSKRHDRTEFMRARTRSHADGTLWATALPKQGSGMLRGIADADALIVVPEHARELDSGVVVEIMPLPVVS